MHSIWKVSLTLIACGSGLLAPSFANAQVNNSFVAFTIPEKDLLPENVAFDPQSGAFFVGSTRKGKILRVDRDRRVTEFVGPQEHGLYMVIGMKADPTRRHLWVASSQGGNLVGYTDDGSRAAGIFQFDLDSGRLIRRWVFDRDGEQHFFNDLVLGDNGDVFATHMFEESSVYVLRGGEGEFERLTLFEQEWNPNGITRGPDGRLYVAHRRGISSIDPRTGEQRLLDVASDEPPTGIDGLYYHNNTLTGVRGRDVRQYRLDRSGRRIEASWALEHDHPMFSSPTTGVVVGDTLFYIANAQFNLVGQGGTLPPMDQLYEVVVLKTALRSRAP